MPWYNEEVDQAYFRKPGTGKKGKTYREYLAEAVLVGQISDEAAKDAGRNSVKRSREWRQ